MKIKHFSIFLNGFNKEDRDIYLHVTYQNIKEAREVTKKFNTIRVLISLKNIIYHSTPTNTVYSINYTFPPYTVHYE